jgi:hypothetical protein
MRHTSISTSVVTTATLQQSLNSSNSSSLSADHFSTDLSSSNKIHQLGGVMMSRSSSASDESTTTKCNHHIGTSLPHVPSPPSLPEPNHEMASSAAQQQQSSSGDLHNRRSSDENAGDVIPQPTTTTNQNRPLKFRLRHFSTTVHRTVVKSPSVGTTTNSIPTTSTA